MKVIDHIKNAKDTLFSIEIIPPLKGQDINALFSSVEPLMEFKPPFIDVTYHREEYVYQNKGNGLLEKKIIRKRPGTVGICASLMNRFHVDAVPHIICGGFTREETENALIDLNYLGIDNVLALRGDNIKTENTFMPEPEGHAYASELIQQIVNMNNGRYIDDDLQNSAHTNFSIGVAGYPEKHFEAPNFETDINFLKKKIDLGADYIVTQMFFNNDKYFSFVEKCRAAGIDVPIIPGLKPITTKKHVAILPRIFNLEIPIALSKEIEGCKDNESAKQVGIEWSIQQAKELKQKGAPVLHYYTMGKSDAVYEIAKAVF